MDEMRLKILLKGSLPSALQAVTVALARLDPVSA